MKKYILSLVLLFLISIAFAQDGAEHKISDIIGLGRVEINIGEQFDVKPEDVFQVFGRGQIIHPATGSLVERDNVYLGKIKVIEVKALSSIAETIERKGDFSVGNRIIKIADEELGIVEHKRPLQAEFERPGERGYSETIYSQKERRLRPDKSVRIIKIEENGNGAPLAIVNKGRETKAEGGRPKIGKVYHLFVPTVESSEITGQTHIGEKEHVGEVVIKSVDHDASKGELNLFNEEIDYSLIEKDNLLQTYLPMGKGFHYIIGFSGIYGMNNDRFFRFRGIHDLFFNYGYMPNNRLFFGAITGVGLIATSDLILRSPLLINSRYIFNINKYAPIVNISVGRNFIIYNDVSSFWYLPLRGGFHASAGIGLLSYLGSNWSLLLELNAEYSKYKFVNDEFFNFDFGVYALKLNIAIKF